MRLTWLVLGGIAAVSGSGCATTRASQATPSSAAGVVEMDEIHIAAARGQEGYQFEAYDAAELFSRATDALNQQKCPEAVALYDRVGVQFSGSRYASAAAYNAGLCLQALGDFDGSAQRYARVRDVYPQSSDRRDASFQLAEVLIQLERWPQALQIADELLALQDLSPAERLEAMARRSQALLGAKRLDEAEAYAKGALGFFRGRPVGEAISDEFFAAACAYVVAETYRERAQALHFPADVEGQKQVLLQRAELVLRAQQEYLATIGFKNLDNYHWAVASGYRLGAMYGELWQSVTHAPVPASVPPSARDVYHAELAKLIRPLIRNAIRYWEATQLSIERAGIKTAWAAKIDADLARVRALLAEEPEATSSASADPAPAGGSPAQPPALPKAPRRGANSPRDPAATDPGGSPPSATP